MPINGYDINPEGCGQVLGQVEDESARLEALTELRQAVQQTQAACAGGTGAVAIALEELWLTTLAAASDATETRIGNAVEGVRRAVDIIITADADMAGAARAALEQAQSDIYSAVEPGETANVR